MNGIRTKEILEILRALEEHAGGTPSARPEMVLATVVSLDGSVYSRAGAMALFAPGSLATIPVKSLQDGLNRNIDETVAAGKPRLVELDIRQDDPILGYGFCDAGKAEILLEPVDARLREHMHGVREALIQGEGVVCAVEIEGPEIGRRALYPAGHPAARECYAEMSPELEEKAVDGKPRRLFLCPIRPMGKVLIFGSGPDAAYLASGLCHLGFTVIVADPRPERLRNMNWSLPDGLWARDPSQLSVAWDRNRPILIEGGWEQVRAFAAADENSSVVIMNHSFALDWETLKGAVQSPASYVGLAASVKVVAQLVAELDRQGIEPRHGVLFAPAGLDIGAETPEETALAVTAEIFAARSGRKGGRLSARPKMDTGAAYSAKTKIPGLILAAGRGRRFTAGHKLSAPVLGRAVLRHAVENALASCLDPVIVVLGCEAQAALRVLEGIEDPRLRVVFNPFWSSGKASSIEVGLREAPAGAPGVVSLLGDMPLVKPWLIDRVVAEFALSGKLTFPVFSGPEGEQKGYPTAFPRALFAEIKALTGDDTAMAAVRTHWSEAVKIPLEDGSTQLDVDTPQDLELLLTQPS